MNYKTPIVKLEDYEHNEIFIKRDDLLPFSFGGNKVRIAKEFFDDMKKKGADVIVGYGNARSNLSRAIANMASSENIECHIVSSIGTDSERVHTYNSKIVELCDATFHYCTNETVAETVEQVLVQCEKEGKKPYYIYGNKFGKGNEAVPVEAYRKAYGEIQEAEQKFDYIFLATGTGMTQAGLLIGKHEQQGLEKIVGISVARSAETEAKVLREMLNSYHRMHQKELTEHEIHVVDDYLMEGYGKPNEKIMNLIREMMVSYGVPLDVTYTGKAYYGMREYIKKNHLENQKILFIHTGGTPLFFDNITKID